MCTVCHRERKLYTLFERGLYPTPTIQKGSETVAENKPVQPVTPVVAAELNGSNPRVTLTHLQFFKLTEMLRTKREEIQAKCSNRNDVRVLVTPLLGFECSATAIENALEATEITLPKKRFSKTKAQKNNMRNVVNAVCNLYQLLAVEMPQTLIDSREAVNTHRPLKTTEQ
jgi:hypothetical protein